MAKRGQKLVLIVIWLYVASKNVAFLYLWTVPKMERFDEITEFELDSESETEDDEDNFEVTDSCSSSKNESCD